MLDILQRAYLYKFSWIKDIASWSKLHIFVFLCVQLKAQVVTRRHTDDKPLFKPTMDQFTDTYLSH